MYKFIIGTFIFLGAGFYQMSGGASFVPHAPTVTNAPDVAKAAVIVPFNKPVVSRAALDSANITAEVYSLLYRSLRMSQTFQPR